MPLACLFRNGTVRRMSRDGMERIAPAHLDDFTAFLRVIDRAGFSAAARELHRTPGAVSKQIARLERALGVRLFERTTRSLRLTSEGADVAGHAREALAHLDLVAEVAARSREILAGPIRMTAPTPFGRRWVAPAVADFRRLHPAVDFELHLSDRVVDLVDSGFDLAIRIGGRIDSRLVARKLATNRRIVVASPDHLARAGTPSRPADLARHACLVLAYPGSLQDTWALTNGRQTARVAVAGGLRSDSGDVLRTWCTAGLGVSLRDTWDVVEELATGTLVRVLPAWQSEPAAIAAVRVHRDRIPRRLEALIDFLAAAWKSAPWDEGAHGMRTRA